MESLLLDLEQLLELNDWSDDEHKEDDTYQYILTRLEEERLKGNITIRTQTELEELLDDLNYSLCEAIENMIEYCEEKGE